MSNPDDILFEQRGVAGIITLNRPAALNAVTDDMLTRLNGQLDTWMAADAVERILIKAVPGRAFSAGGDIRHLYDRGREGAFDFDFFAREYALNARIAALQKPYIALVDGIAMGGGVGVSFHGSLRVGGEAMAFAMPEVGIGFFPDVGGSYILSRLPGKLGLYLGLTGTRLKQADALWAGLITHACASDQLADLETALISAPTVDDALSVAGCRTQDDETDAPIVSAMPFINQVFAATTVEGIVANLEAMAGTEGEAWAEKTLSALRTKSPTSLKIAFRQITYGADQTMADCMRMEYRILRRLLPGPEFYEGIRAAIIDKDNAPRWSPDSLNEVTDATIDTYFEPLPLELELPLGANA
ncbi:MAG: enoyl-CoA hydratase/isomerase family protein [Pseudomonadota bacterium]